MLRRAPVKKLSTQRTTAPSASRRPHKCEPRKPAPPVTSTRVSRCICFAPHANKPMPPPAEAYAVLWQHQGLERTAPELLVDAKKPAGVQALVAEPRKRARTHPYPPFHREQQWRHGQPRFAGSLILQATAPAFRRTRSGSEIANAPGVRLDILKDGPCGG